MNAKHKRFIVLTLGDIESWGFNEETMPMLLQIVDSSVPDYRMFTHTGVVANYLTSPRALKKVENVVAKVEILRDTDSRFAALGIGLSEGEMLAEFDWLGRLKTNHKSRPLGQPLNEAAKSEREPQRYKDILQMLRQKFHGNIA